MADEERLIENLSYILVSSGSGRASGADLDFCQDVLFRCRRIIPGVDEHDDIRLLGLEIRNGRPKHSLASSPSVATGGSA